MDKAKLVETGNVAWEAVQKAIAGMPDDFRALVESGSPEDIASAYMAKKHSRETLQAQEEALKSALKAMLEIGEVVIATKEKAIKVEPYFNYQRIPEALLKELKLGRTKVVYDSNKWKALDKDTQAALKADELAEYVGKQLKEISR